MREIDFHYTDFAQAEPILRVADLLKERGLQIHDHKNAPIPIASERGLLAQQTLLSSEILEHRTPILVLERADAAICWDRRAIKHVHVQRVFKTGVLCPPELNNACWGRYHSLRIQPEASKPPRVLLSDEHLAKLTPLYNYAVYSRMEGWLKRPLPLWQDRPFLLNFAGTTTYGPETPEITAHRHAAVSAIRRVPGEHSLFAGRTLSREIYDAVLSESRICVSPWGLGEICHRDVEALFAGCILIKPDTSFVSTWPPLFENGLTYLPCRTDFADLAELTERVLDCPGEMQEIRARNRAMLETAWSREHLADRIERLLTEALDGPAKGDAAGAAQNRPHLCERLPPEPVSDMPDNERALPVKTEVPIPAPPRRPEAPEDSSRPLSQPDRVESAAFIGYGDTRYPACPMCESSQTNPVWKIPFSRLEARLPVGNLQVQYLPTFGSRVIYEYSHCESCESLFLDPYRSERKGQYASVSNPGAREKIQRGADREHASWKGYEARYDYYLKPHLPTSGTLVDAACGAGQYLVLAREDAQRQFERLIGLEISPLSVEHLASQGFEASLCDLDCEDDTSGIPRGSVDFLIFSEAFEHVVFPLRAMRHLVNMLKSGGRLFFSAQRVDDALPVRPGENHCLSAKGYSLLLDRLDCEPVLTVERPGKWISIIEKR